jgi:hypothetical protein
MGGVVVDDEMDVEIARHIGLDLVEKLTELAGAMGRAKHLPIARPVAMSRGKEGGRAAAGLVVAALRRAAWPGRIGSIGWLRSRAWICDFSSTHSSRP